MAKIKTFFKFFGKGMRYFGEAMSALVNSVLLFVIYFLGIGFTSLVAKISKKKFLELKPDKNLSSYWGELNTCGEKREEFYRQF